MAVPAMIPLRSTAPCPPLLSFQGTPGLRPEGTCGALRTSCSIVEGYAKFRFGSPAAPEFYSSQERFFRGIPTPRTGRKAANKGGTLTPCCLIKRVSGSFWEEADSDSSASERFSSLKGSSRKPKMQSVLMNLIQDIEPLDIGHISKDASPNSMDAMKRTISGMLGLLPSDQFHVMVETDRDSLGRLLVSSMMTGYTLRNAEYRMSLQRSLDFSESGSTASFADDESSPHPPEVEDVQGGVSLPNPELPISTSTAGFSFPSTLPGNLSPEVLSYIHQLQSKVNSISQQLDDCKRTLAAIELEDIVGDEPNDVLDYLRSLDPEKVTELSQPSPDVRDAIQQVIDNLLGSLSPLRSHLSSPLGNNPSPTTGMTPNSSQWEESNGSDPPSNLQFQSTITTTRDYLARLLFWCMMLGHHLRALEYRLELSRTFNLACTIKLPEEGLEGCT